jgi:enolase-phosphatase E1
MVRAKALIKAIVTDIEGTTSSISFVKDVLFPYAAEHLPEYIREHRTERLVREQLNAVAELAGTASHDAEPLIQQLLNWIASDTKATPLKALQGMIWEHGYRTGSYRAHVYADAVQKLTEWHEQKLGIYVYSSGSIQAQKLFFEHSVYGDMRPLFIDYFDTTTGAKQDENAYRAIATSIGYGADEILFLSDIESELDAARAAGMQTCWLLRPDDSSIDPTDVNTPHSIAVSFDEIQFEQAD